MDRAQELQSTHPLQSISSPWLVCSRGEAHVSKIFSLTEKKSYSQKISEIAKKRFWVTSQGWLLMQDQSSRCCFLWSPMTLATIELPAFKSALPEFGLCLLSTDPTDPRCMVLFNIREDGVFWFCQRDGKKWIKYNYGKEEIRLQHIVSYEGKFYGYSYGCDIHIAIDFDPSVVLHKFETEHIHWPMECGCLAYVVECRGDIFHVLVSIYQVETNVADIAIYKLDSSTKSWCEVESIGDNVFFLDPYVAASRPAKDLGVKGDLVYFVMQYDLHHFYTFDINEGTLLKSPHSPNPPNDWHKCFWILSTTNK